MFTCPSIKNEKVLDEENLPPIIDGLSHGVIWIPLKNDDEEEAVVDKIKGIFCDIKEAPSVAVLTRPYDDDSKLAKKIKEINKDFAGPYRETRFNGIEADIIVYVTTLHNLYIQTMARARRLLIVVTLGENWSDDSNKDRIRGMNEAVRKNLVKKISNEHIQPEEARRGIMKCCSIQ